MDFLQSFFTRKMIFLLMALASIMVTIEIGNKVGTGNPTKSPLGYIIEKMHTKSISKESNFKSNLNAQIDQTLATPDNADRALIGMYIFLIVLTGVLTVILACVVLCMLTLGVAEPASLIYAIIALIICIAGLVMSIIGLTRLRKRMKEEGNDPKNDTKPTF